MIRKTPFPGTELNADQLAVDFSVQGRTAETLHGDKRAIMDAGCGKIRLLVATDWRPAYSM